MIHVVIELTDVNFQTIPCPHSVYHQGSVHILHALVDSSALDTGIGVFNENVRPMRPQNLNHIVVNDSVWEEWRNHQHPFLGIVDYSCPVLAWNVGLVVQHLPQLLQPLRDVFIELTDFITILFAFLGIVLCPHQPFTIIEQVIEIFELCALAHYQLSGALHVDVSRLSVRIVYVVKPMGIAPPHFLGENAFVPLAQIRVFNLLTHTDSTLAFFYQLPAVARQPL